MWVAELEVWHAGALQFELTKRLDVVVATYYLNVFKEGSKELVAKVITVRGKDRQAFIDEMLKKDKRYTYTRVDGDQIYYCLPANNIFHHAVLDKSIFFVKPILVRKGFEYWAVASWEKKELTKLVDRINGTKGFSKARLLSLKQGKLSFFIPSIFSELTDKQRAALELAFENGYYEVPRRASVEELAGLARAPRATFQEHLRKAEAKLLPAVISELALVPPPSGRKRAKSA